MVAIYAGENDVSRSGRSAKITAFSIVSVQEAQMIVISAAMRHALKKRINARTTARETVTATAQLMGVIFAETLNV